MSNETEVVTEEGNELTEEENEKTISDILKPIVVCKQCSYFHNGCPADEHNSEATICKPIEEVVRLRKACTLARNGMRAYMSHSEDLLKDLRATVDRENIMRAELERLQAEVIHKGAEAHVASESLATHTTINKDLMQEVSRLKHNFDVLTEKFNILHDKMIIIKQNCCIHNGAGTGCIGASCPGRIAADTLNVEGVCDVQEP